MPAMPCTLPDALGSVKEADDGDGDHLPGAIAEEGGLPIVRSGGYGGVATDTMSEPACRGSGGPGRDPPPPSWVGPNLPGIFTETYIAALVPGGGVPGRDLELDQPPGSICTPPRAGHNSDTGGGEPTVPQVPPV